MKLLLLSMTIIFFMKSMLYSSMIMSNSMMIIILLMINYQYSMMYESINMDMTSTIMIALTIISIMLINLSSSIINKISKTMIPIFLILLMTFSSSQMMLFYIMFEAVLIPTMILITMSGKQPERLQASIYLVIYTITMSLPLLASIIIIKNNPTFLISITKLIKYNMIMFLMLAFLVKMPMYFSHLWLPKAHVEAPLEGSMILAAILLKLGGYGLIRFLPLCIKSINKINTWIISISLIGATATSMNCIRQKDLKSLIAYSSIAHMGLVLTGLFTLNTMGFIGAITMMIAHGLSSSALFLMVNDLYSKYYSRNIILFKGLITLMPNITFWWFMFMATNISAPPSINTMSEIMLMSSMLFWNNYLLMMIFMASLMATSFSMMLFININHNKTELLSTPSTQQKMFMSMFIHLTPLMILLFKIEILMY